MAETLDDTDLPPCPEAEKIPVEELAADTDCNLEGSMLKFPDGRRFEVRRRAEVIVSEIRARRLAGGALIGAFLLLFLAAVVAALATDGLAEDWWLGRA